LQAVLRITGGGRKKKGRGIILINIDNIKEALYVNDNKGNIGYNFQY